MQEQATDQLSGFLPLQRAGHIQDTIHIHILKHAWTTTKTLSMPLINAKTHLCDTFRAHVLKHARHECGTFLGFVPPCFKVWTRQIAGSVFSYCSMQRHESGKFLELVFWHASRHESRKFLGLILIHTSRHVSDKSPAPFSYIFQRHESGKFLGLFSGMRQDMNPDSFYDVSSMFQGMSPTNRRVCFPYTKAWIRTVSWNNCLACVNTWIRNVS